MVSKKKSRISTPFIIITFTDIRVIFLISTLMIIIQYRLNYVNGRLYNILRLILYIFVIITFMISGEYSYCSGKKTFDVKYIPFR